MTKDTKKIIPRSTLRSAAKTGENNLRLDPARGEEADSKPIVFIHHRHGDRNDLAGFKPMAGFDPDELIGRTFLKPPKKMGSVSELEYSGKLSTAEMKLLMIESSMLSVVTMIRLMKS